MKGLLLAGGTGSRLYPLTIATSKQLLAVYDKPMIYYPLSTLMLAGIQDILVISSPEHTPLMQRLLGDGSAWGISLSYQVQPQPQGIAQAFLLAEHFIAGQPSCLVLGDNIFYGHGLIERLKTSAAIQKGATVFAYYVRDPRDYGIIEFDNNGRVRSIEEKPQTPKSNYAVPGLYFYDSEACRYAKELQPSVRGEYEISSLNQRYLEQGELHVEMFGRGIAWLDTGTQDNLLEANNFVSMIERRTGLKICCPEEIAYRNGWISAADLAAQADKLQATEYGQYLRRLLNMPMKS